jgi:PAS domain S-box-containing protein
MPPPDPGRAPSLPGRPPSTAAARRGMRAAVILVASIVVSGSVLAVALAYLRSSAVEAGQKVTQSLAQVIAEQTARTLQTIDARLEITAGRLQMLEAERRLDGETARALLKAQVDELPFLRGMWTVDRNARVNASSRAGDVGLVVADRAYFQIYQRNPATEFFVGPAVRSRVSGNWLISATRALRTPQGEWSGIIVAAVEPPYFEQTWKAIELGEGGSITVFSRDGRLLMRTPHDDDVVGKDFSSMPLFSRYLPAAQQGLFAAASPIDGIERVVAYRVLPSYPNLVVAVGSSSTALLAGWRRFAQLTLAVWLLAIVIASALTWQLQRQSLRRERNELRFYQLAQAMPQIVFIADWSGEVQFFNDRWVEATGTPVQDALGLRWARLIHPDDRDAALESMARSMSAGEELQHEHRLLYRDGVYRWQLARAVPVHDIRGKVFSWYGTSTEIDQLKQAQAQLKAQADLLSMAGRLARMGGWVVEPRARQITWSDEAAEILDMPPASSPTLEQIFSLFAPASRDKTIRAVQACIDHGTPFDVEVEMVTASGRPIWVRSIGRAIRDADGHVERIEGAQQDITERVRLIAAVSELNTSLEEKIEQRTSELQLANEQLESFSYSVSHDLRAPLQRIASFAQLLQKEEHGSLGERARHYLERIHANTDYMTQLIDGLLALASVSQMKMLVGPVNLSDMAAEILERMQAEQPERQVRWEVAPRLRVLGDARLMKSVMENLIGNAWKFTSGREGARISVGATPGTGEYFVRDNGAGFDMAYADKLFGTFQRLHGADEFPGTGIGLATVARAVARQGGSIRAEAELGKGATFYFKLPLAGPSDV